MIPLLPFFAGLAAGAAAVSALRSERAKRALNETGSRLRTVASGAENSVRAAARSGIALLHRPDSAAEAPAPAAAKKSAKVKTPAVRKPAAAKPAASKRVSRTTKADT
ncbi:MAG: hypothetical protein A2Z95_01980 [Gallionellales bacterium GWA2_60_18]|nr:MAG: hypothetical protein A2Z95_01980 [Gallionellales bacterium GWA2_60_18]